MRRRRPTPGDDGGPEPVAVDPSAAEPAAEPDGDAPPDADGPGGDAVGPTPEDDELLLTTPLDDSDLAARLEAAGRRGPARSTLVLAAIALLLFGFAAGVAVGRAVATMEAEMTGAAVAVASPQPVASTP